MSNKKHTKQIITDFIIFSGLKPEPAAKAFNITVNEWLVISSGETLPGIDLLSKILAYSMSVRHDISCSLNKDKTINDLVAIEAEQLNAITNLLHGHRSQDVRQIGNLIAGPVSRLSALTAPQ